MLFQLSIVNNTLAVGEKALVFADGGIVEDWIKTNTRRLLVVVAAAKAGPRPWSNTALLL